MHRVSAKVLLCAAVASARPCQSTRILFVKATIVPAMTIITDNRICVTVSICLSFFPSSYHSFRPASFILFSESFGVYLNPHKMGSDSSNWNWIWTSKKNNSQKIMTEKWQKPIESIWVDFCNWREKRHAHNHCTRWILALRTLCICLLFTLPLNRNCYWFQ